MACETDSSIHPQERWDREHHRQNPQTCTAAVRPAATAPRSTCLRVCILLAAALATSPQAGAQQMDPAAMQRQIQQQMGGSPGGGGGGGGGAPPPNRIVQLVSAAGAGGASIARSARRHPRAAVAATTATAAAVWAGKETCRSGLQVCRSPRVSLFRPPDAYLSRVLEAAADAPVASPLPGVILSMLSDPEGDEEREEDVVVGGEERQEGVFGRGSAKRRKSSRRRVGGGSSSSRNLGGEEPSASQVGGSFEILAALGRARGVAGEGAYMEETWHGKGKGGGGKGLVKSVRAGVRVGSGLGIFHKFAQGMKNLDVFDGQADCELLAAESSSEDVGSTLGLLTRTALGAWSLSALRVVLRRERALPVATPPTRGSSSSRRRRRRSSGSGRKRRSSSRSKGRRRKGRGKTGGVEEGDNEEEEAEATVPEESHRQYTLALSAVEGAGWSGTWVFRVTHDVETDEVWFETRLAQRRGAFGTTSGGDQVDRVKRVNRNMMERANKHAALLRKREEQFTRVSSLARARAKEAKELARDRILNPDKYKRVHRYMREDSHTTGGARARPARWGEERRRNDIRLKN